MTSWQAAGYRLTDHNITPGYEITFGTGYRRDNLYSTFIQDQVQLTSSLALTVGSKFEHNDYTGFELRAQRATRVDSDKPSDSVGFRGSRGPAAVLV